jgi:hypothetical protein
MSLRNIETFILLDWFITDFDSKFQRYRYTGDEVLIKQVINAAGVGRLILAKMRKPIQEIAKTLTLDLSIESVEGGGYFPSEPRYNVYFLSFGKEVNELKDTYATQFVIKLLDQEMQIKTPALKFKLFYLPPLPAATSDEGHIMTTLRGFTNAKNGLIGINLYPPWDYAEIFQTIVHEILHAYFLDESNLKRAKEAEAKVEEHERAFVLKCQGEYSSQKNKIDQSIKYVMDNNLPFFQEAENAFNVLEKELRQAGIVIDIIRQFFDAVMDRKVRPIQIQ